jgi:hypothetical protein
MMFRYYAYGLHIESAVRLPELTVENGQASSNVVIRYGKIEQKPVTQCDGVYQASSGAFHCFWQDAGKFLVQGGQEIIIEPADRGMEKLNLEPFITGPLLALLLHQRGLLILHASAVVLDGEAIAFLGDKGWGKSTTAASLQMRRHRLVADDVLAIDIKADGSVDVLPAFPQIKLWPNACDSLGIDPEEIPRLHPKIDKRVYSDHRGFSLAPVRLRHLYVLDGGENILIERLAPREAFMQLVRHSFVVKYLQATGTSASHFSQCGELANSVSTFRIKRPFLLSSLYSVTDSIEEHFYSTHSQTA